jgi:hypothetical protein
MPYCLLKSFSIAVKYEKTYTTVGERELPSPHQGIPQFVETT